MNERKRRLLPTHLKWKKLAIIVGRFAGRELFDKVRDIGHFSRTRMMSSADFETMSAALNLRPW